MEPTPEFIMFRTLFALPATLILLGVMFAIVALTHDNPPIAVMIALVAVLLAVMVVYLIGTVRALLYGAALERIDRGHRLQRREQSSVFDDYAFDLMPVSKKLRMTVGGGADYQDAIARARQSGFSGAIAETNEQPTSDPEPPMQIWLQTGSQRICVGVIEGDSRYIIEAASQRLFHLDPAALIPAEIVEGTDGLRVELLTGLT